MHKLTNTQMHNCTNTNIIELYGNAYGRQQLYENQTYIYIEYENGFIGWIVNIWRRTYGKKNISKRK